MPKPEAVERVPMEEVLEDVVVGNRYRFRWVDREFRERETVGRLEAIGETNLLVAPLGWRSGTYQSFDLRRVLTAEEIDPIDEGTGQGRR